ncbi:MAG TPA: hypothetical protein DIV79_16590 [Opitutae bacterium]|nr:hypothetical protein [Opitutae bacterium]
MIRNGGSLIHLNDCQSRGESIQLQASGWSLILVADWNVACSCLGFSAAHHLKSEILDPALHRIVDSRYGLRR